jgi:Virulence-associated protein E-like domain/NrS-1  polymerase HBD domain
MSKTGGHILAERFGTEKRWVVWKLAKRKGKTTKLPYTTKGALASSTDSHTWCDFKTARAASEQIGIVFTQEKKLLGIDIDHCLKDGALDHPKSDAIRVLLDEADTYTEISPSGNGLHLYFALKEPLELEANRHESFECYTEGRYFTVTNNPFETPHPVREITPAEAKRLLSIIGYPWGKAATSTKTQDSLLSDRQYQLSDETLLEKMFASSNGADVQALHNGDISKYKDDRSRADMAYVSHLAFWTGKNAAQMERLWLLSPLGNRKKVQERADYRKATIDAAIERCTETYNPELKGSSEISVEDPSLKLLYMIKDKRKVFYKNTENIARIIKYHPEFAGSFRYDTYRSILERRVPVMLEQGSYIWRDLEDRDAIQIQTRISVLFSDFANVGKEMVYDAIIKVAHENEIDSGADYLRSLKWDGKRRLDQWIVKTYHTPDDEYHRKIASNWLKGMVKRIIEPGCKFDYVLVLEGAQGIRKSTSLMVLAGNLGHVETTMSTETKDFFMQFLGNAIVEFSEGETLSRTEVKRMKALITVQTDKFRQPYGRAIVPHPRRCVFAMTTNQQEYLKDETGNRRWLPVAVKGNADLEWLEANREQILAEAYVRVINERETTYEFPEEEMEMQQNLRRIHDPNDDRIVNWYLNTLSPSQREDGVLLSDVWQEALNGGLASRAMTRNEEMGIADVLRTVLMLEKRRGMIGGIRITKWYPTDKTGKLEYLGVGLKKPDPKFSAF